MTRDSKIDQTVIVGICAMAKKSRSRPMREIIVRLEEFDKHIKVKSIFKINNSSFGEIKVKVK